MTSGAATETASGMPSAGLIERLLADDPAVWRPACDELVARIWPPTARRQVPHADDPAGGHWVPLASGPAETRLETRDEPPQALGIAETRHSGVCVVCGAALAVPRRGPQPSYCSRACRTRAWRARSVDAGPDAGPKAGPKAGRWSA